MIIHHFRMYSLNLDFILFERLRDAAEAGTIDSKLLLNIPG